MPRRQLLDSLPDQWEVAPLGRSIVEMTDGPFGSSLKSSHYVDEGVRVVRLGNIGSAEFRDDDQAFISHEHFARLRRHEAREGDLIVAGLGDENHALGRACVLPNIGRSIVKADCFRLRLNPRFHAHRYMAWFLSSDAGGSVLESRAQGATRSRVNLTVLSRVPVPYPPLEDQESIIEFLDRETSRIDSVIERKQGLVEALEDRWVALLWHVMTKGLGSGVEFKSSGLEWAGQIPAHWGTPPVYALFDVQLGKMLNAERAAGEHQAPYLRNVNVQWDRFDLNDLGTMSFSPSDRIRYRLEPGDLLVCEGGEVGRSAIWNGELEECFYQKAIHRVRARADDSTRFLMYALWCAALMDVFAVEGNRATIVHLTAEKLREHRLPMPPVDEQQEIVNHLDAERQRTIELQRSIDRQVELLRERRQALITAAVTGQIDVARAA